MKIFFSSMILVCMMLVICAGCGDPSGLESPKKLQDFYPGDISSVDHVEVVDGRAHVAKTFTDKEKVQNWINTVRDLELKLDPDQQDRTGNYLFLVHLYEGNREKLSFTTGKIENVYLIPNEHLKKSIEELFGSK